MLREYSDIIKRLGPPLWFDDNGVPRYEPFHPSMCGIYDEYVALLDLRCQRCSSSILVAVERRKYQYWPEIKETQLPHEKTGDLGGFHYGDPPRHNMDGSYHNKGDGWGSHCSGVTMTSFPARIIEFWFKNADHNWERDPAKEFEFREELGELNES